MEDKRTNLPLILAFYRLESHCPVQVDQNSLNVLLANGWAGGAAAAVSATCGGRGCGSRHQLLLESHGRRHLRRDMPGVGDRLQATPPGHQSPLHCRSPNPWHRSRIHRFLSPPSPLPTFWAIVTSLVAYEKAAKAAFSLKGSKGTWRNSSLFLFCRLESLQVTRKMRW